MSDNELDLDAEILGMVGDDGSDDSGSEAGDDAPTTQPPVSHRTPSEEPKPSVEKVPEEPQSAKRGVAQKVRRKGGRKKVNKRELEDELDDLNDSPSPSPAASDAMIESDFDPEPRSVSPIEDGPAYPLEGIYIDSTDRARIQNLPEIEREEILAERAAENTKRQQDLQLKKALAATQLAASKHQKRKAAAADLDDDAGQRKSSRAKVEKRNVLDDYKKAREARGADRTSRLDPRRAKRRSRSASSAGSDRDADGESEVEWAPETTSRRGDEPPAELKDFERCRVGRSNFAKVCFYPDFEETMKGCFARVSIGVNRDTGENLYRMTQIKGFKPGKPYTLLHPSTQRPFNIDTYALVAHGSAEKLWPFSACSDSKITQQEFDRYVETLTKEHIRIPKRGWLQNKLDDIHKFLNVEWTDTVLAGKFARQREMERRLDPANAAKIKKEGILKRKAIAETEGDMEEASRCDAELAALENNAQVSNGTPMASRPSPLKKAEKAETSQDVLARLNQKNRGKNTTDVRQALIEERKKRERAIEAARAAAAEKAKLDAEAKDAAKSVEGGLLAVPSNKSMMKELFGDSPGTSRAGTPFSGVGTPGGLRRSRAGTPINGVGVKGKSGLGASSMKMEEEDVGLDLGIDVEI